MFINTKLLKSESERIGVTLDEKALLRFDKFAVLLLEWNKKMNLTGITEPDDIVIKHFVDSLTFLNYVDVPEESNIIDVGTGAGFPAIPLLIARNDLKFTLLDSLQKRLNFLDTALSELGLEAELLHARGEDAGQNKNYREKYDFATARAVANMSLLSELSIPFVKTNGSFVAMKGPEIDEELDNAMKAIETLGGSADKVNTFTFADGVKRNIIVVKKISQTPTQFPRSSARIAKKPL